MNTLHKRKEFRIKSEDFQALVNDFVQSFVPWTSMVSNKLEWILQYQLRNRISNLGEYKYAKFDTNTNELVFLGPAEFDAEAYNRLSGDTVVFHKEIDRSQETFGNKKLLEDGK